VSLRVLQELRVQSADTQVQVEASEHLLPPPLPPQSLLPDSSKLAPVLPHSKGAHRSVQH
jgi:hypothetical protein